MKYFLILLANISLLLGANFAFAKTIDSNNEIYILKHFMYGTNRAKAEDFIRVLQIAIPDKNVLEYDKAMLLVDSKNIGKDFLEVSSEVDKHLEILKEKAENGDTKAKLVLLIYERKTTPLSMENTEEILAYAEDGNPSACHALTCYQYYYDLSDFTFHNYKYEPPSEKMRDRYKTIAQTAGFTSKLDSLLKAYNKTDDDLVDLEKQLNVIKLSPDDKARVANFYNKLGDPREHKEKYIAWLWAAMLKNNVSAAIELGFLYADGNTDINIEKNPEKIEQIAKILDPRLLPEFYFGIFTNYKNTYLRQRFYYDTPSASDDWTWRTQKIKEAFVYNDKAAEHGHYNAIFIKAMRLLCEYEMEVELINFKRIDKVSLKNQKEILDTLLFLKAQSKFELRRFGLYKDSVENALFCFYFTADKSLQNHAKAIEILENSDERTYFAIYGQSLLFLIYNEGFIVEKNENKAKNYLENLPESEKKHLSTLYEYMYNILSESESYTWQNVIVPKDDKLAQKYLELCFETSQTGSEEAYYIQDLLNNRPYSEAKKYIDHLKAKDFPTYYEQAIRYYYTDKKIQTQTIIEFLEKHPEMFVDKYFYWSDTSIQPYLAMSFGLYGFTKNKNDAEAYLKKYLEAFVKYRKPDEKSVQELRANFVRYACKKLNNSFNKEISDADRLEFLNEAFNEFKDSSDEFYEELAKAYLKIKDYDKSLFFAKEYIKRSKNSFSKYSNSDITDEKLMAYRIELLKFSAQQDIPFDTFVLSALYREGRFVEKDIKRSDALLEKIPCNFKNSEVLINKFTLGNWIWGKSLGTVYYWTLASAKSGNVAANTALMFGGMGYGSLAKFMTTDKTSVLDYAQNLEKSKSMLGFLYLYILYEKGISPFEKDTEKAEKFARAYESILKNEEPPFWASLQREILKINIGGNEFFTGKNYDYALFLCEQAPAYSGIELSFLEDMAMSMKSEEEAYAQKALALLKNTSEKNYQAKIRYESALKYRAIKEKRYADVLELMKDAKLSLNNNYEKENIAFLIKIAIQQDPKEQTNAKIALEKIFALENWNKEIPFIISKEYDFFMDEPNLIENLKIALGDKVSDVDFSKITTKKNEKIEVPDHKRINSKKYFKRNS